MAKQGMLAQLQALRRAEQHVLWLRANLSKHPITLRVERELLLRRTAVAVRAGTTVDAVLQSVQLPAANPKPQRTKEKSGP
ncbi:MAG: hypothetical protein FJX28_15420 [Alphaproteobacteria bacterium]|nr:hypothetical protein [Alphaproteobacteria bacterium]